MGASEADKMKQRQKEICELAIVGIVTHSGVSYNEAAGILLTETARNLEPIAIKAALARAKQ